ATSVFVRIAVVAAVMDRKSFPARSGAASIAHMLKCDSFSSCVSEPLPTSSMSGSFQCPGPAYPDSGASASMRLVMDDQLALMSNAMRHWFARPGRSRPHDDVVGP